MSSVCPIHVAAFTSGATVPGARFRVRQYIPALARAGITVTERWPRLGAFPPPTKWLRPAWLAGTLAQRVPQIGLAHAADVTWLYRELVSTLVTFEGLTPRPRLLDVDDSIHLFRDGNTARRLARLVDLVVVSSPYLADAWRRWTPHVEVLPMAVDTDLITPAPLPARPVIGWLGSPGNLAYLESIAPALAEVTARFPGTSVAVCSERQPSLPGLPMHYVPWSPAAERPFLESLSIGIVPLADTPWERGKFSYKMLLYMAAGRPVVGSPVGSNADMLHRHDVGIAASDHGQWVAALSTLLADHAVAQRLGAEARLVAVRDYSITAIAPRLAQIFRRLAS